PRNGRPHRRPVDAETPQQADQRGDRHPAARIPRIQAVDGHDQLPRLRQPPCRLWHGRHRHKISRTPRPETILAWRPGCRAPPAAISPPRAPGARTGASPSCPPARASSPAPATTATPCPPRPSPPPYAPSAPPPPPRPGPVRVALPPGCHQQDPDRTHVLLLRPRVTPNPPRPPARISPEPLSRPRLQGIRRPVWYHGPVSIERINPDELARPSGFSHA